MVWSGALTAEARLRVSLLLLLIVTLIAGPLRAASAPAPAPAELDDVRALDRDDAAAEAALAAGDVEKALRYFHYSGHEQEAFARATVEYRRARLGLRRSIRAAFGAPAWEQAAADLGEDKDEPRGRERELRREGDVLYSRSRGARHEVPYVNADGVWKVSVRDVLLTAVRARFGAGLEYEEADLYVLAGKMAKVLDARSGQFSQLADDVGAGRVTGRRELRARVRQIRRGGAETPQKAPN